LITFPDLNLRRYVLLGFSNCAYWASEIEKQRIFKVLPIQQILELTSSPNHQISTLAFTLLRNISCGPNSSQSMILTRLGGSEKLVDLIMSIVKKQIEEWNFKGSQSWKIDKGDRDREELTSEAIWILNNCSSSNGIRSEIMRRKEGVEGLIVCLTRGSDSLRLACVNLLYLIGPGFRYPPDDIILRKFQTLNLRSTLQKISQEDDNLEVRERSKDILEGVEW